MDATELIVENYQRHHLDCLVCLGGGGTQKNALHLARAGLDVVHVPKTIDNDVTGTDTSIGFDTALTIATEAIDRLHSTAHSHHRIVVVELMGHNVGWLALGAGLASGADVILIPEIPYDVDAVAEAVLDRRRSGRTFSIVAVSEGARSRADLDAVAEAKQLRDQTEDETERARLNRRLRRIRRRLDGHTHRLAQQLEKRTRLESRVTILGHVQRGGVPTPADRMLATRLGAACADGIYDGLSRVMFAARGEETAAVPLDDVAGIRKTVPLDHPWLRTAREIGVDLGESRRT
jgi:6-phosphofructokinase 1